MPISGKSAHPGAVLIENTLHVENIDKENTAPTEQKQREKCILLLLYCLTIQSLIKLSVIMTNKNRLES